MRHLESSLPMPSLSAEVTGEYENIKIKNEEFEAESFINFDINEDLALPIADIDSLVNISKDNFTSEQYVLQSPSQVQKRSRRKALQPQRTSVIENNQLLETNSIQDDDFASILSDDEYSKTLIAKCEQVLDEEIQKNESELQINGNAEAENVQTFVKNNEFHADVKNEDSTIKIIKNEEGTDALLENIEKEREESTLDIEINELFKSEVDGIELDDEMQKVVNEEWKSHWGIKCNVCHAVFPFRLQFESHYSETHLSDPVYSCCFCNKPVTKYSTFRSHCYRHVTENRHKCEQCNKGFSLKSMLKIHITSHHTGVKPFVCKDCGKSFVTKNGFNIHLNKHRTPEREDFPCNVCSKVLHTRGGLTAHMNVHKLGRRFMCDKCGKTFTQKVNMQQHVKQHTGEKPHKCDECGKCFAEKSHLTRHYSFHSQSKPFKCETCNKMFKTERCVKVHSQVHAKFRPHICSYCSKGFLSSTKLKQHLNIHTGERPFKCKHCEKTFTNGPNLLKHNRRRHAGLSHKLKEEPVKEELDATSSVASPQVSDVTESIRVQTLLTDPSLDQPVVNFQTEISDNLVLDYSRLFDHNVVSAYTSDELKIYLQSQFLQSVNAYDLLTNLSLANGVVHPNSYQQLDGLIEVQPQPAHPQSQFVLQPIQDVSMHQQNAILYSEQPYMNQLSM